MIASKKILEKACILLFN